MEQRLWFDTVAQLYDSIRPGYPPSLIDDLLWLSRITPGAHILDIGCGTGKSTEPFAARGFKVCALDPGSNMLEICKEKLRKYPNVSYVNATFETWAANGLKFDLVISGTAFHWMTEVGGEQLLRLLNPQGSIGIFWHTFIHGRGPIYEQINQVYKKYAPDLYSDDPYAIQECNDRRKEERLLSWTEFSDWRVIRYYSHMCYTTSGYLNLLRTWSDHSNLSDTFFNEIASVIDIAGGKLIKPIRTTLCFAKGVTVS